MITSETGCEFSIILSHLKLKPKAVSRHVEREIHYHCWHRNQIYVCAWRHLDHTEADCSSRPADSGLAPTTENQPLLHRRVYDLGGALANNWQRGKAIAPLLSPSFPSSCSSNWNLFLFAQLRRNLLQQEVRADLLWLRVCRESQTGEQSTHLGLYVLES